MRWAASAACALLLLPSCTIANVVHDLDAEAPPAEFGRPGWVRGSARVGAWVGALSGAVFSVAALPFTYPISLLADEPLGYSKDEFLLVPITGAASLGHFMLGAPPDMLHFVFYRAWVDEPPQAGFDFTPMQPPVGPGQEMPLGEGTVGEETRRE